MNPPKQANCNPDGGGQRLVKVVFVGAFKETTADGALGGTLYASRSLVASRLSEFVDWELVDSTARSVPAPPTRTRAFLAAKRMSVFARAIARKDVDAVLIFAGSHLGFLEKGTMALVAKQLGKPVILCPRSGLMLDALQQSRVHRWFARRVLERCDRIVCQGETWRRFYAEFAMLPGDRLVTIPNWIDPREYDAGNRLEERRATAPTFLFLGWVEPYKGILDLIDAVALVRSRAENARFLVCGGGAAMAEARLRVDRLGLADTVIFRGWVRGAEKRAVLAESDVLVLPSHREGLPNAVLEGMASGLPIIATKVGAIPDVVEHGRTGLLVEPRNVESLADAIALLASDVESRRRMARAAREVIEREHDVEVAWPRFLNEFRAIRHSSC